MNSKVNIVHCVVAQEKAVGSVDQVNVIQMDNNGDSFIKDCNSERILMELVVGS